MTATTQWSKPRTLNRVQKLLIGLLAVIWIAAGIAKLAALPTFKDVLENHGVLSARAIRWAWMVPALEVIIGLLVLFVGGNPAFPRLRRATAIASAGLLVVFCVYIWQVPEDVFQSVGCGCEGALGLTDFTGAPSRSLATIIDLLLAAAAWAVWRSHHLSRQPSPPTNSDPE